MRYLPGIPLTSLTFSKFHLLFLEKFPPVVLLGKFHQLHFPQAYLLPILHSLQENSRPELSSQNQQHCQLRSMILPESAFSQSIFRGLCWMSYKLPSQKKKRKKMKTHPSHEPRLDKRGLNGGGGPQGAITAHGDTPPFWKCGSPLPLVGCDGADPPTRRAPVRGPMSSRFQCSPA